MHLTHLKRFAVASLLCLCVTAMCCGAALVNSNSRALSLGEPGLQAGFQMDKQTVTFFAAETKIPLPAIAPALRWARLAPAPVGSLVEVVYEALGLDSK